MTKVMIHPATYEQIRPAVDRAFELFPVSLRGKRILIKPNLLRGSDSSEGIVTHPAVLRTVVEKVETMRPAGIVVGDNPGLVSYGASPRATIGLDPRSIEVIPTGIDVAGSPASTKSKH